MTEFDGTPTQGRKGLPYDWRAVIAEYAAEDLDVALAALLAPTEQFAL